MTDTSVVPRDPGRPPASKPVVDGQLADQLLAKADAEGVELLGPDGLRVQVLVEPARADQPDRRDTSASARHLLPTLARDVVRCQGRTSWARCVELRTGSEYLAGVESAAAVLIPVSWFLTAGSSTPWPRAVAAC